MEGDDSGSPRGRGAHPMIGPWQGVDFHVVRDPRAGRMLSDAEWKHYLAPFLGRTLGIAEAARELERPLEAVRYRVHRMHEAGLLDARGERRRAGRPVRLYRSVADGFVVPFQVTPFADQEERLAQSAEAGARRFARAAARHLRRLGLDDRRIYRAADGKVYDEAAVDASFAASDVDHEPLDSVHGDVMLPRAAAQRLLLDFYAAVKRAQAAEVRAGTSAEEGAGPVRRYGFGVHLAPLEDD